MLIAAGWCLGAVLPASPRWRDSGLPLRGSAHGAFLGAGLADLLARPRALRVEGELPAQGGLLVLGAHLGPWEAAAATLAQGARPVLVVAAPWPRLPGLQAWLQQRRAELGVQAVPRGARAWRQATGHLRGGGAVVVLVDSGHPHRSGRRPLPFPGGPIADPQPLLDWARRNGAAVRVAVGHPDHYELHEPRCGVDCVQRLARAIEGRPHHWAWVHALAALALMVLPGCAPAVPPLPLDPEAWRAEARGVRWDGEVEAFAGTLIAERASLRYRDGPGGRFHRLRLELRHPEHGRAELQADEAEGRWPDGPMAFYEVSWSIEGVADGTATELGFVDGRWTCGGCPVEGWIEGL